MVAGYFTKPLQGALFTHLRNHIMGAEFTNGDSQTHRSVLDNDDHDTQMEASEQEQNNKDIHDGSQASEREQNNEDVCGVSVSARDQNNENICDGSEAHDQNNTDVLGVNQHLGLRTAGNLTMFSNLRTEGRSSNHLLLGSNPLKMFDYQEDLVEIIEADKRWDFRFDDGDIVPRVAFHNGLRSVSDLTDWDDVTMTIIYKDEIIHTDDLLNDPKFARFMNISVLERKYLNMRDVQKSGPQECVW